MGKFQLSKIMVLVFLSSLLMLAINGCGGGGSSSGSSDTSSPIIQPLEPAQLSSVATISIDDPLDTNSGFDIVQVKIAPENEQLRITIFFADPLASDPTYLYAYLYGTNRDKINFTSDSFELLRDNDANGHFEESITVGSLEFPYSNAVSLVVDQSLLPDLLLKQLWFYKISNQERVPNLGTLNLGIFSDELFDIFYVEDDVDPGTTADLLDLQVSINDDLVIFTTLYDTPIPDGYFSQKILLYGDSTSKIIGLNLNRSSQLYLDQDEDGLSSELIFFGGANLISPNELEIQIPRVYLPEIYSKNIWVTSPGDRAPDSDSLILE